MNRRMPLAIAVRAAAMRPTSFVAMCALPAMHANTVMRPVLVDVVRHKHSPRPKYHFGRKASAPRPSPTPIIPRDAGADHRLRAADYENVPKRHVITPSWRILAL